MINLVVDHLKKDRMIGQFSKLGIEEFEILSAFEPDEIEFTIENNGIFFNEKVYQYGVYEGAFPFRRQCLSSAASVAVYPTMLQEISQDQAPTRLFWRMTLNS